MTKQYTKPVCRGSYALGTACGHCERCVDAKAKMDLARTITDEELETLLALRSGRAKVTLTTSEMG